ncbi:MAG TPA: hypothetical protein HPP97_05580 [Desulfuromonadales bacterium]|nr:hypothetical protein [Desulfuromonadales bacterium]
MKKTVIGGLMVTGFSLLVGGCGGGGGDTPPQPTMAVLTLKTAGTPSGAYKGIELTVNLPATVSVKTDPLNPKQTAPGALKLSGVFARYSTLTTPRPFWGRYSSAGAGKPSVVIINISSGTAEYPVGEFATLTCNLASGQTASLTDFSVVNFAAYGTGGADITGLTASPLGVTLK